VIEILAVQKNNKSMNMKWNRMTLPWTFALAAMLATGCHHYNGKVTNLPEEQPPQPAIVGDGNAGGGGTLGAASTFNNTPGPISNPNPIPLPISPGMTPTTEINLDNFIQDRAALAAYMVHFKFDSAVVQDSEQSQLTGVAQALGNPSLKLLIEGHCDERGTEEYNRALGERRALALREALGRLGVDANRIKTISYGKDKPVDFGHNEAAWRKNRRGDFILLHPKGAGAATW
jgi:peptidoglycan-associated lipoprotein